MEIMLHHSICFNGCYNHVNIIFINLLSIDTSDTSVVKQVDNTVEFSFYAILAR